MKKSLIGKHINSAEAKTNGWIGEWPIIDANGIITGSHDGDSVPEDAVLVDWSTDKIYGYPVVVDGDNGFEAILNPDDERAVIASNAAAALGHMTSDKKAAASRANGKRGGRPKKEQER